MPLVDAYVRENRQLVRLNLGEKLGEGNYGAVYRLDGAHKGEVLKRYHTPHIASRISDKIDLMLSNRPSQREATFNGQTIHQLAWPTEKAFDPNGKFVGFLMPEIDASRSHTLESIFSSAFRKQSGLPDHYGFRLSIARNLAHVLASVHASGLCMIDVKPDNIRFYKDCGFICIIDCDGFVPTDRAKEATSAACTPGFIIPEANQIGSGENVSYEVADFREKQDDFALAILIFMLLNDGWHPFSGKPKGDAERSFDEQTRIFAGLYAFGLTQNPRIQPPALSLHEWFDRPTREMFDRAFASIERPTAQEWDKHLTPYAKAENGLFMQCRANSRHWHFKPGCGLCAAEATVASAKARKAAKARIQAKSPTPTSGGQAPYAPAFAPVPLHTHATISPPPPPPPSLPIGKIIGWGVGLLLLLNMVSCVANFFDDLSRPSSDPAEPAVFATDAAEESAFEEEPYVPPQFETSYNCSGVLSYVEQTICGDASLAAKDREMAELYSQVRQSGNPSSAQDTQRGWLEARERCGGSGDVYACINSEYDRRISELRRFRAPPQPIETSPRRDSRESASPASRYATGRGEPQPESLLPRESAKPTSGVLCILPSGEEVQLSYESCRQQAGVIYE